MITLSGEWVKSGSTQAIFDIYQAQGFQLFFVGGCVRNALLDVAVSDIDMCSDAPPDVATEFLEAAGLRVIPTGIEHGTVTVLSDGLAHEITTFRKDVATDGRRATVAFSSRIEDDARRRDFTINALYADRHGRVVDPLGGLQDIDPPRVRFIEDPQARIREDYLRILRFFRFHARFAVDPPDAGTLDAIARNIDGLAQLSLERITAEMLNILSLPDPAPTVGIMQQTGVLQAVLAGADMTRLAPLVHMEELLRLRVNPLARLAVMGGENVIDALRLSKSQRKDALRIHAETGSMLSVAALGYELGADLGAQVVALRCAVFETHPAENVHAELARGAQAIFPVKSGDLNENYTGPALGKRLAQLKSAWRASDLTLTREALLSLPDE